MRSAAAARRGHTEAPAGTVARAKLAAQEMRCLDQSLAAQSPGSAHAADFRARYIDAGTRLALPAAPADEGNTDD